jgi:hypothetical protein
MRAAVRKGLIHGIILSVYALIGYLIAYIALGGSL